MVRGRRGQTERGRGGRGCRSTSTLWEQSQVVMDTHFKLTVKVSKLVLFFLLDLPSDMRWPPESAGTPQAACSAEYRHCYFTSYFSGSPYSLAQRRDPMRLLNRRNLTGARASSHVLLVLSGNLAAQPDR